MVIDCMICDMEYHLTEELVREAIEKGIPIRCSTCGFSREVRIVLPYFQEGEVPDRINIRVVK